MVRLRQLHWINLRTQEWNLRALTYRALDFLNDGMSVAFVLAEQEWCGIRAALELSIWLQSATSLGLRHP